MMLSNSIGEKFRTHWANFLISNHSITRVDELTYPRILWMNEPEFGLSLIHI